MTINPLAAAAVETTAAENRSEQQRNQDSARNTRPVKTTDAVHSDAHDDRNEVVSTIFVQAHF